jgi:hypothetical protein
MTTERVFEDVQAVRSRVPLLIGIMGPSGSGKTFSALRLATGMQKVTGGEIFGLDSESKRMLHYAEHFKFRWVNFGAPFSPLDYLQAFEFCKKKGATTVVVDSMSHEHEGPGGVLEWHAEQVEKLSGGKEEKADRVNMLAWAQPKAARRRLINTLLQMDMNVILCFRAKDKIKPVPGGKPESLGWMPIAGEEYLYEMNVNFLLPPAAGGVPQWQRLTAAQEPFIKVPPKHFQDILRDAKPLDESTGEAMALWASGSVAKATKAELQALMGAMLEAGYDTEEKRKSYVLAAVEKKVGELTTSDVQKLQTDLREQIERRTTEAA